jgi:hypothetical protein
MDIADALDGPGSDFLEVEVAKWLERVRAGPGEVVGDK